MARTIKVLRIMLAELDVAEAKLLQKLVSVSKDNRKAIEKQIRALCVKRAELRLELVQAE